MKLISLNVGRPRLIDVEGETIRTSIFKEPVGGRVRVRTLNIDGDEQSDLTVHGGRDKAVYAYPSEHYASWRSILSVNELGWGAFGENLTTEGLLEDRVAIGDRVLCGTVEMVVTQPRLPCYKLALRHRRAGIIREFMESLKSGFYLAVLREGELAAGDAIELIPTDGDRMTVKEIFSLFLPGRATVKSLRRASVLPALPESWRERFAIRADELET